MRTQQQKREDGHMANYRRFERARSAFNRPLYGYRVTCECGWTKQVNGDREEARGYHNAHLNMDVK